MDQKNRVFLAEVFEKKNKKKKKGYQKCLLSGKLQLAKWTRWFENVFFFFFMNWRWLYPPFFKHREPKI